MCVYIFTFLIHVVPGEKPCITEIFCPLGNGVHEYHSPENSP